MDIGAWNQPLVSLSHPMAISAHTQSELRLWEATMWMIKQCQCGGRGSKQSVSSAGCDIYIETEREGFNATPFSPTLCLAWDIWLPRKWTRQRGLLTLKVPGGTRAPTLLIQPLVLPYPQITGLWALSLLLYVATFQTALSHPQLFSSAATRNSHVQSGSVIIIKLLLRTLTCTSVTHGGGRVLSSVPELWPMSKPKQLTRSTEELRIRYSAVQTLPRWPGG